MPTLYDETPAEKPTEPGLTRWRNRIIGHGIVAISDLLANPLNWRVHPVAQKEALRELIDEVGVVGPVMINVTTGNMVDGHLRSLLADEDGETHLPADYVELSPEDEAKVLAGYDTITAMALVDKAKLAQTMGEIASTGPSLSAALTSMLEHGASVSDVLSTGRLPGEDADDESDEDKERSTGELLAKLMEVTIGEPKHAVRRGEVWRLGGTHLLIAVDPIDSWSIYVPFLTDAACKLVIYPGPFAALTDVATSARLVMVQPDLYLAGHVLDRYADVHGDESVVKA